MAVSAFTNIPTGLKQKNNHPLDGRALYNTIAEALADNPYTVTTVTVPPSNTPTEVIETNRFIGQKMVIVNPPEGDSPREYWFRDGITDGDLVKYDEYEWEDVNASGSGGCGGGGGGVLPPTPTTERNYIYVSIRQHNNDTPINSSFNNEVPALIRWAEGDGNISFVIDFKSLHIGDRIFYKRLSGFGYSTTIYDLNKVNNLYIPAISCDQDYVMTYDMTVVHADKNTGAGVLWIIATNNPGAVGGPEYMSNLNNNFIMNYD